MLTELLKIVKSHLGELNRVLVINGDASIALDSTPSFTFYQTDFSLAKDLRGYGFNTIEDFTRLHKGNFKTILIHGTKFKELNYRFFILASECLDPNGGSIFCVFSNKIGAARYEKEFFKVFVEGNKISICKKSSRFFGVIDPKFNKILLSSWRDSSNDHEVAESSLISSAGIFSSRKIDQASKMFAEALCGLNYSTFSGIGADFGCGYGYLSYELFLKFGDVINKIYLLDSSYDALRMCSPNLNNILIDPKRYKLLWCDISRHESIDIEPSSLDWIIMNPPFHQNSDLSFNLGVSFFHSALKYLKRRGVLYWVANKHLPYLRALGPNVKKVEILQQDSKFVVCAHIKN